MLENDVETPVFIYRFELIFHLQTFKHLKDISAYLKKIMSQYVTVNVVQQYEKKLKRKHCTF